MDTFLLHTRTLLPGWFTKVIFEFSGVVYSSFCRRTIDWVFQPLVEDGVTNVWNCDAAEEISPLHTNVGTANATTDFRLSYHGSPTSWNRCPYKKCSTQVLSVMWRLLCTSMKQLRFIRFETVVAKRFRFLSFMPHGYQWRVRACYVYTRRLATAIEVCPPCACIAD